MIFRLVVAIKDTDNVFLDNETQSDKNLPNLLSHLMKVNCSPYMLESRARLGYFPKGGTIRLNTRAMQTNTAGRTICKTQSGLSETTCITIYANP